MPELKITSTDGLIESNIKPRKEIYYLVTEENIKNINGKNILSDVFTFIASVLWGAYFSVTITINASEKLAEIIYSTLKIYQSVFLYVAILVTLLAVFFHFLTYRGIDSIKKSTLPE